MRMRHPSELGQVCLRQPQFLTAQPEISPEYVLKLLGKHCIHGLHCREVYSGFLVPTFGVFRVYGTPSPVCVS